jgi:hypothetical protein
VLRWRLALAGFAMLGLAAAGLACASTVTQARHPALELRRLPIQRVAVAPFGATPEEAAPAASLVARHVTEALVERGIEVIGPEDVARALGDGEPAGGAPELAALVHREFGADGLLLGEITRWVEREGSPAGTLRPAAVGVRVELYGAPEGDPLWEGEFDRTQQTLLSNVLVTPRYPGGGTRWLTAEEFAQFAASELAAAVPLGR